MNKQRPAVKTTEEGREGGIHPFSCWNKIYFLEIKERKWRKTCFPSGTRTHDLCNTGLLPHQPGYGYGGWATLHFLKYLFLHECDFFLHLLRSWVWVSPRLYVFGLRTRTKLSFFFFFVPLTELNQWQFNMLVLISSRVFWGAGLSGFKWKKSQQHWPCNSSPLLFLAFLQIFN